MTLFREADRSMDLKTIRVKTKMKMKSDLCEVQTGGGLFVLGGVYYCSPSPCGHHCAPKLWWSAIKIPF